MTIPLPTAEAVSILNLQADMANNPVFDEHRHIVMATLANAILPDAYLSVTAEAPETPPTAGLVSGARFAYALLLLASTAEFLNLKTLGDGIVKTTGLDNASTTLLSGDEIDTMKRRLTVRALSTLKPWLSDAGMRLLAANEPRGSNRFRVAVI